MNKQPYRQGDVLLIPVDTLPGKLQEIDPATQKVPGRLVLAYGEVTGHYHSFAKDGSVALLESVTETDEAKEVFLKIMASEGATLTHQEHRALTPSKGNYKVIIQKQYTPEAIINVID